MGEKAAPARLGVWVGSVVVALLAHGVLFLVAWSVGVFGSSGDRREMVLEARVREADVVPTQRPDEPERMVPTLSRWRGEMRPLLAPAGIGVPAAGEGFEGLYAFGVPDEVLYERAKERKAVVKKREVAVAVAGVVQRAVAESTPMPAYPREARRLGLEGTVYVGLTVGVDGGVTARRVTGSSGHRVLDLAALDGVEGWKFRPARGAGGEAVASSVVVPVRFELK